MTTTTRRITTTVLLSLKGGALVVLESRSMGREGRHRSIAILATALLMGVACRVYAEEAGTDPQLEEARQRIAQGRSLGEESNYDAALVEFLRASELLEGHPSQHIVEYNIGSCYEGLSQYGRAVEHYHRYLEGAGPDAEDRGEVESRIEELEQRLGTLRLRVNTSSYEVWLDGEMVGSDLTEVMAPGGHHTVEIRAQGYLEASQEVDLLSRAEQEVSFELERQARLNPAIFWTSLGLALITAGVGFGLGGFALSEHNALETMAADPVQSWQVRPEDNEELSRFALIADVLIGFSALFAISTLVTAFFTDWGRDDPDPDEGRRRRSGPSIALRPSPFGIGLEGAF